MRHVDWREWMASFLVNLGVVIYAASAYYHVPWFWLGAIPLTFGVRLAIDLGKEGGGS